MARVRIQKLGHVLSRAIVAFAYNFETDISRNILLTEMTSYTNGVPFLDGFIWI